MSNPSELVVPRNGYALSPTIGSAVEYKSFTNIHSLTANSSDIPRALKYTLWYNNEDDMIFKGWEITFRDSTPPWKASNILTGAGHSITLDVPPHDQEVMNQLTDVKVYERKVNGSDVIVAVVFKVGHTEFGHKPSGIKPKVISAPTRAMGVGLYGRTTKNDHYFTSLGVIYAAAPNIVAPPEIQVFAPDNGFATSALVGTHVPLGSSDFPLPYTYFCSLDDLPGQANQILVDYDIIFYHDDSNVFKGYEILSYLKDANNRAIPGAIMTKKILPGWTQKKEYKLTPIQDITVSQNDIGDAIDVVTNVVLGDVHKTPGIPKRTVIPAPKHSRGIGFYGDVHFNGQYFSSFGVIYVYQNLLDPV